MTKIRDIRPIAVSIPMSKPIKMAGVELKHADNVLVRIETREGIVGWGEAASAPSMTGETVESMMAAIRYMAPHLAGLDLEDVALVSSGMNRLMYGNKGAKSAIEIGLHDALGKSQGKPVHDLLGGKRRGRIPMLQMIAASKVDADVAEAQRSKALGYVAFKVKVGTGDPRVDADRTRRVCEALGPGVLRCSDANQGWSVDQAIEYVRALEGSGLDFFEQPVMADDLEGMAKIAAATDIAIGCDEGVHHLDDLRRHREARAARGASLKAVKLGGLRGVIDAAALCEALDMKVNLAGKMSESGIATAAVLHLAAAAPALDWGVSPTSPYLAEDVLAKPLVFANGHAEVPTGPGLGIEIDERQVRKFTIER
ncbi:MAG TPA: enolase C-terminal domain-like protein [Burkholderiales bacterium]|nr:enolase C-terminal domain-like protein [Burkholderiales bacterium]